MRHFIAVLVLGNVASACRHDLDCSLNGACNTSEALATCVCRPGWTGTDCGQLDFVPASTEEAFYRNTSASWGGSIIFAPDDGRWHMFLALMQGHCGLNTWQPNSAIYHAISSTDSPAGPYVNETMVIDWFSHNPTATRAPDGTYLVWHIGCGTGGAGYNYNCTNGTTPLPPPPPPAKLVNQGQCLISNGTFPCWNGGGGDFRVCPLVLGDCDDPSAAWQVGSDGTWSSNVYSGSINVDCNACVSGTVAKLFGSSAGTRLHFNASTGQIEDVGCPGMCLSTGTSGHARPPCGGGSEPWLPTQIQVASCREADTAGWTIVLFIDSDVGNGGAAAGETVYPAPCTDVNTLVSTTGVFGPYVETGVFAGNRVAPIYELDNPAPWHFANGSTWVMGRSWHPPGNTTTPIGIARSNGNTWNTTYTIEDVTYPQFASVNATAASYSPLEDPFLWVDADSGTFHALFHNMGACATVGCHAFSPDGFVWYLATTGPYTNTVNYVDGSSKTLARRERPHLVFNAAGHPAFLSNGVQDSGNDDHTYTHVHPINVAWP